ncbi:hypothetical protein B0J18DRAFT_426848 [Chaetomium sp. MPI-SDFR-AT-0129]|nr:hypothetical protein B0J18DRAFT_426848 [Chaetomium sp. MPI-SDFR-AT-0129]
MSSSGFTPIQNLPPELLLHIFSFLDKPPPSSTRLNNQPSRTMFRNREIYRDYPLKQVSLVCRHWREAITPSLFRHILWTANSYLELTIAPYSQPPNNPFVVLPLLNFLHTNRLTRYVQTLTVIFPPEPAPSRPQCRKPNNVIRVHRCRRHADGRKIRWPERSRAHDIDHNWLWDFMFRRMGMNLTRLTFVASAQTLGLLLGVSVYVKDAYLVAPGEALHVFSLSRPKPPQKAPVDADGDADMDVDADADNENADNANNNAIVPATINYQCDQCGHQATHTHTTLLHIQPWTTLLLNENRPLAAGVAHRQGRYLYPSIMPTLILGLCPAPPPEPQTLIPGGPTLGPGTWPATLDTLHYTVLYPLLAVFQGMLARFPPRPFRNLVLRMAPTEHVNVPRWHGWYDGWFMRHIEEFMQRVAQEGDAAAAAAAGAPPVLGFGGVPVTPVQWDVRRVRLEGMTRLWGYDGVPANAMGFGQRPPLQGWTPSGVGEYTRT